MLQATIELKLSKDHSVIKNNVTPIEALFLVAEHHGNVGENPLSVIEDTVTEIGKKTKTKKPVKVGEEKDKTGTVVDKYEERVIEEVIGDRTVDEELARLRQLYGSRKIAVISNIRDLPATFEKAASLGVGIVMPTNPMASPNATVIAEVPLKG